jgi:hypothetical protein
MSAHRFVTIPPYAPESVTVSPLRLRGDSGLRRTRDSVLPLACART